MAIPEQVKCPFCKLRLFDLWSKVVRLDIKCPKCKSIVTINTNQLNNMHTEQRSQVV